MTEGKKLKRVTASWYNLRTKNEGGSDEKNAGECESGGLKLRISAYALCVGSVDRQLVDCKVPISQNNDR
jgi:hypothetical protein